MKNSQRSKIINKKFIEYQLIPTLKTFSFFLRKTVFYWPIGISRSFWNFFEIPRMIKTQNNWRNLFPPKYSKWTYQLNFLSCDLNNGKYLLSNIWFGLSICRFTFCQSQFTRFFVPKNRLLLTNQHFCALFKISLRFSDDNIWFATKNLNDQNPK